MLRFLLGVAEAGFFPAIMYYLSQWYPASMRASSGARFMIAIPLSGVIGGPLGGWLLGLGGRRVSPDGSGSFSSKDCRRSCSASSCCDISRSVPRKRRGCPTISALGSTARLAHDRAVSPAPHGLPPLRALAHPLIWLAALPELLVTTAGYAYLFWGPILVRDALHLSNLATGLLGGAIALLLGAAGMLVAGASSDRTGDRVIHAAACALVVALRVRRRGAASDDAVGKIVAIIVMQLAVISFLAPFWALPTMLLSGGSAAVGIALVNAIGNVGGFIGPNVDRISARRAPAATPAPFSCSPRWRSSRRCSVSQ